MVDRETINKIIEYGTYAPSSHNSQPWQFTFGEKKIEISPDFTRRLIHGDRQDRQLFISLGCAAENIRQASEAFGFEPSVDVVDGKITVTLGEKEIKYQNSETLLAIKNRITSRYAYAFDDRIQELLDFIKNLQEDCVHFFICERELKAKLADVAVKASVEAMDDIEFRKELSRYVKNNTTSSRVGMPAYGMGVPTFISYIVPIVLRFVNANRLSRQTDSKLLKERTPYVVVIATKNDDKSSWLKTGFLYERIALEAEKRGFSAALWAAPIEIGDNYKNFQALLSTRFRPQAFFRLGKATKKPPRSPRLTLQEVLK